MPSKFTVTRLQQGRFIEVAMPGIFESPLTFTRAEAFELAKKLTAAARKEGTE